MLFSYLGYLDGEEAAFLLSRSSSCSSAFNLSFEEALGLPYFVDLLLDIPFLGESSSSLNSISLRSDD